MRRIIISGQPWALGMYWLPMQTQKFTRGELIEQARATNPKFDLFTVWRKTQCAFGYSEGESAAWRKTRSLAAFLPLPSATWIGLFVFEDPLRFNEPFWWVFARNQGAIVELGDQVFASEEEAKQQLALIRSLLGTGASDPVMCLTAAESQAWLSPLLHVGLGATLHRRGRIQTLRKKRFPLIQTAAIIITIGLLGGFALNVWLDYQATQRALEEARLTQAQREARRRQLLADPGQHFSQDWMAKPLANHVALTCTAAMQVLPTVSNGWLLDAVSCLAGRSLQVFWRHDSYADYVALPEKAHLQSPKTALAVLPVDLSPLSARPQQLFTQFLAVESVTRHLYQVTQTLGAKIRLTFKQPEKRTIDKVDVICPWVQGEWELSDIPFEYANTMRFTVFLAHLPGLSIEKVTLKNDLWTLTGRVYAQTK